VLDVGGEPLGPVSRAPYDQAVPAGAFAAGCRHREAVPLAAPLPADPDELSQQAPSGERDHDYLAGDREELGRQAAHAKPGVRHEDDERGQQQRSQLAEQSGQTRARRQRLRRLDRNDDGEGAQRRPAAEPLVSRSISARHSPPGGATMAVAPRPWPTRG